MAATDGHLLFKAGASCEYSENDNGAPRRKVQSGDVDQRRREWNRVNAARSRARRKYLMACAEERRESLVRENQALLALLERAGVDVSVALLRETLDATSASGPSAKESGSVPVMNAAQMEIGDGGFVRLMQSPGENGAAETEDSHGPRKRARKGAATASVSSAQALCGGGASVGAREMTIAAEDFAVLRTVASCKQHFLITDYGQADNPIVFASNGFWALTGYEPHEILGRNCRFLQGKDTDPRAVRILSRCVKAGQDVQIVLLNYRKDGSRFWNYLFMSALRDETGKVLYFIGVQTHLQPELARPLLEAQEAQYAALADEDAAEAEAGSAALEKAVAVGRSTRRMRAAFPDLSDEPGPASGLLPRSGTTGGLLALLSASADAGMLEASV